jgi:hypothetical protein
MWNEEAVVDICFEGLTKATKTLRVTVSGPRVEPGTPRIISRNISHSTMALNDSTISIVV